MAYIHQRGGRFLSVLPRTRGEDRAFRDCGSFKDSSIGSRSMTSVMSVARSWITTSIVCESPTESADGYRLVWYHSTRKAELDAEARVRQVGKTSAL